ncbi:hypothetical protein [Segatella copri]|uniref:hypothetical protein n=1 Tax=Segatella copri TaxID=165179 RepID=UPI0020CFE461|nr:hypothetical protein [Segatella copri]MCP9520495.1 hypothetical protein [Segatella copri]
MATETPLTATHYSLIIRELNALVIDVAIKTEKQHHVEWLGGGGGEVGFCLESGVFICIRDLKAWVIVVEIKTEKQHHVEWLFGIPNNHFLLYHSHVLIIMQKS